MALSKVKTNSSGGKGQARFLTRAECKDGARKRRRRQDRRRVAEQTNPEVF